MLWADPQHDIHYWRNSIRGSGFAFGNEAIDEIFRNTGIELVVRGHQHCMDGFWTFHKRKIVTVFSAPAYTNQYCSASAMLRINEKMKCKFIAFVPETVSKIRQFRGFSLKLHRLRLRRLMHRLHRLILHRLRLT